MVRTKSSIRKAVKALAEREKAFAGVVDKHGIPEPRSSEPGTHTLLRTIVGQQVSVAAARSMWSKLEAAFGSPPDLNLLLAATDEDLRAAGISRQKAGYIRSLAELVISGELDLHALPEDNEEAIAHLIRIKGIGRWSAEIYLLFAEGRADVWPAGDLAVQIEIGRLLGMKDKPSEKQLREIGERWRPHRGAAAILAWHSYNSRRHARGARGSDHRGAAGQGRQSPGLRSRGDQGRARDLRQ
jgi:DNA-3-methyladenine glycosylase II